MRKTLIVIVALLVITSAVGAKVQLKLMFPTYQNFSIKGEKRDVREQGFAIELEKFLFGLSFCIEATSQGEFFESQFGISGTLMKRFRLMRATYLKTGIGLKIQQLGADYYYFREDESRKEYCYPPQKEFFDFGVAQCYPVIRTSIELRLTSFLFIEGTIQSDLLRYRKYDTKKEEEMKTTIPTTRFSFGFGVRL